MSESPPIRVLFVVTSLAIAVLVGEASPSTLDPAPVPDHRAGGLREVWELFER